MLTSSIKQDKCTDPPRSQTSKPLWAVMEGTYYPINLSNEAVCVQGTASCALGTKNVLVLAGVHDSKDVNQDED